MEEEQFDKIVHLLQEIIKSNSTLNETMIDLVNLFKKYEVDEVLYSENLRED